MVRICLNVLVGIPASGKSTYCEQLTALSSKSFEVIHVCFDSYINIDREYDTFFDEDGMYRTRRRMLLSCVEAIIQVFKENNFRKTEELLMQWKHEFKNELKIPCFVESSDYVFIIDDNNYYRSMRYEWLKVARKFTIGYFETYFNTPLPIAVQRNQKRVYPIKEEVITRMWTRLEKPCAMLNRWEQDCVSMEENPDFQRVVAKIRYCFDHPQLCPSTPKGSHPMEQSMVHKVDILVRKSISRKVAAAKHVSSKDELQTYVNLLQQKKKCILEQIRTGEQEVLEEQIHSIIEDLF